MQRLLWLAVPLVMSGCVLRDHERDDDYDSSWDYESKLEVQGRRDTGRQAAAGSSACVTEADQHASVSHERARASQTAVRIE